MATQTKLFPASTPSLKLIKEEIDQLSTDPTAKLGLRLGFLGLGPSLLLLAIAWYKLPPELPLLYSRPYGQDQLINYWQIWLLPLIAGLIEIIAVRSASSLIEKDKLLTHILVWSATLITLMILITIVQTVRLAI